MRNDEGLLLTSVGPVTRETQERMYLLCAGITMGGKCTCRSRDNVCDQIAAAYVHRHTPGAEAARISANVRGAHRRYLDED